MAVVISCVNVEVVGATVITVELHEWDTVRENANEATAPEYVAIAFIIRL